LETEEESTPSTGRSVKALWLKKSLWLWRG